MKGNYFLGSRQFQVREMSFPPLGDFEVKIQNMAAGICGTDIHIYHGEKGSAEVTPPVVLGHEYAGVVVETGRGVTTVRTGDHVTVDPNIYCGTCPYCKAGKKQLCSNLVAVGVNFDGGFAQYSVVPEGQVYRLNPEVSFAEGAMAEPLACCIHGVELAGIELGDTVCDRPADGTACQAEGRRPGHFKRTSGKPPPNRAHPGRGLRFQSTGKAS